MILITVNVRKPCPKRFISYTSLEFMRTFTVLYITYYKVQLHAKLKKYLVSICLRLMTNDYM